MMIRPQVRNWKQQDQVLADKPHFARWLETLAARSAVMKGKAVGAEWTKPAKMDKAAQEILFGKRRADYFFFSSSSMICGCSA
jgi:GSH-dependent disulfide-bond oxidoreductase